MGGGGGGALFRSEFSKQPKVRKHFRCCVSNQKASHVLQASVVLERPRSSLHCFCKEFRRPAETEGATTAGRAAQCKLGISRNKQCAIVNFEQLCGAVPEQKQPNHEPDQCTMPELFCSRSPPVGESTCEAERSNRPSELSKDQPYHRSDEGRTTHPSHSRPGSLSLYPTLSLSLSLSIFLPLSPILPFSLPLYLYRTFLLSLYQYRFHSLTYMWH